jgi:hypothetical protein
MDATTTFNTSAAGLITACGNLKNPITARYPEAPAWPTDEYSNAATKIRAAMVSV